MLILGIETSCDETSAAVVGDIGEGGKLVALSNIVASQIETHRLYGGVVPEIAGRAHIEAISGVVERALSEAKVQISDLDGVAVTTHPGLIGALLVGVNFAKAFAFANKLPLISVNHIHAHTAASYLTENPPKPPYLSLVVSGGHTSFYLVRSYTEYVELGGTRDDAAGEAFDKIGRVIGLQYPAGAAMDRLAHEGIACGRKLDLKLPSPALTGDNLDFSFSGLKTAALNYLNKLAQQKVDVDRPAFAALYTDTVCSAVAKKIPQAIRISGAKQLVMSGGVAANSHLRAAVAKACEKAGAELILPPISLCGDNGVMVAAQGYYELKAGRVADTYLNASASDD
ncbi:MAG: tRNA (adenosine(37)-N6)-threonylcarbamoyltransferase complex transferase subunit TsaD [Clostridia bacterium]|nr:tRNA (adenosine(37)-N6)-threonylcarbamoyltransferase complex transferase subunit TsaD [Clostridia bacterium]